MNKMITYWILNLLGGIMVLGSYILALPRVPSKRLWAGIKNPMVKNLYVASMLLAAVAYLIFLFKSRYSVQTLFVLGVFFLASTLWAPSLLYKTPWVTLLCLSITSLSVFFLTIMEKDLTARICLLYFLFHVFVLDNLYWGIRYFDVI